MTKYLILLTILLLGCSEEAKKVETPSGWKDIVSKKEITFLTMNSSSSYFQGKDGEYEGFEYELAKQFAQDHNFKAKFVTMDDVDSVLKGLEMGLGHIGVAGITNTEQRRKKHLFGPSYFSVYQTVVCKRNHKVKKSKDLSKLNLIVSAKTSYEETLNFLKKRDKKLKWSSIEYRNSESLLQEVWKSKNLCTLSDSHLVDLHRRYLPELKKVFQFQSKNYLSWAMNIQDKNTKKMVRKWFAKKETQELIEELKRKYFDFIEFDPYNLKVFNKRIKTRLPKYKHLFQEAAKKVDLPWELIAAVGYQESFWNPRAKSPTGVRGIMMLTRRTAKELGVKNRIDPKQSIDGGARYLKKLIKRMPEYMHENDRIWFALAAYNVGYYHLRDALALSVWRNKDPTRWHSVETVLPLLSEKKWYRRLMYGHARGLEPVIYVNRIKDFYDILKKKN